MKMRFNELYFPAVFLLALICFFTVPNLAVAKGQTFLVEFQDPDFLKILEKYSHVVYDKGRTLLIELDFDYDKLPKEIKQTGDRDITYISTIPRKPKPDNRLDDKGAIPQDKKAVNGAMEE